MRAAFILIFILILSSVTFAEFRQITKSEKIILNPKQVTEARFRIALSGTLATLGNIEHINLTLNIPQEGVEDIKVTADAWGYVTDGFGNRLLLLEWRNPSGVVQYRVETTVTNKAKTLAQDKAIASNPAYLKENDQIRFTPELRKIAFPFEKSLRRAAELTAWVHDYLNYDLSLVGELKPSDWVYENKRGVCVEYANLLSALLKISGIPTRYIVGYAYSTVENKLIGHTWVEILTDGGWVPLDATWLQAGYLDATHIKTAVREDANQTEKLTYSGKGDINVVWDRNEDEIELLSHKVANVTDISLSANDIAANAYGLAKAVIRAESCTITEINITSCVGTDRKPTLDILEAERKEWVCPEKDVYWVYNAAELKKGFLYTCPINAYDQTGSQSKAEIEISGEKIPGNIEISGPDTAAINENFVLLALAKDNFVFFSPKLGSSQSRTWNLSLNAPGKHKFYLYSNGALAIKEVEVMEKKGFSIIATTQRNVTFNGSFILSVTAENLLVKEKTARIRIDFDDEVIERQLTFAPKEAKTIEFNITAAKEGVRKISAAALSDTISSYTTSISVYEEKKPAPQSIIDAILSAIAGIYTAIAAFIAGLLPK